MQKKDKKDDNGTSQENDKKILGSWLPPKDKRITFREDDEKYWGGWLPEDLGDRLTHIKQFVKHLLDTKKDIPQIQYYTPHGIEHCQAVEDIMHKLIPGECHKNLGESEKFFLLGSAWLHDVGMLRGIFPNQKELNLSDDEIRDNHHRRSEEFLISHYRKVGIKEFEASAFALLARYHRRRCPINECPEYLPVPEHGSLRLRLLAAYLRLADALHINQTRAPSHLYAMLLAYNIPIKSKLHWLRSKFVLELDIDVNNKAITVHLKSPHNTDKISSPNLKPTLDSIYSLIVQDLVDELDSVKNVLFACGITYFLQINKEVHKIKFDDQFLKDINGVSNYYHLLDNPSSSAIYSLVLESIQGIVDSHNVDYPSPDESEEESSPKKQVRNSINTFLKEILERVLKTRTCHTGLENLLNQICLKLFDKQFSVNDFGIWIRFQLQFQKLQRKGLRLSACRYFSNFLASDSQIDFSSDFSTKNKTEPYNILLYGYSELVAKTLCGFRDAVIIKLVQQEYCEKPVEKWSENISDLISNEKKLLADYYNQENTKKTKHKKDKDKERQNKDKERPLFPEVHFLHKQKFEKEASELFRIFCCEAQPKNHTAWKGRILCHDGINYARALAKKAFHKIYVIPDAVAPSLINGSIGDKNIPVIDFVLVGANGFNNEHFKHSAGHSMVVNAAHCPKLKNKPPGTFTSPSKEKPTVILSVTTDKYEENQDPQKIRFKECPDRPMQEQKKPPEKIVTGGWQFRGPFGGEYSEPRYHSFFCQDPALQDLLKKEAPNVLFYNPREDSVPIKSVDVVITEKAFLCQDAIKKDKGEWEGKTIKNCSEDNKPLTKKDKTPSPSVSESS